MQKLIAQIAQEIRVEQRQVLAAVELLDGATTVPGVVTNYINATGILGRVWLADRRRRDAFFGVEN